MTDSIQVRPTSAEDVTEATKAYAALSTEDGLVDKADAVAALRTAADELEADR